MCNNSSIHHHRSSTSFNDIVEPFPFSTFHFLRTCNRLLIPTTSTTDSNSCMEISSPGQLPSSLISTIPLPSSTLSPSSSSPSSRPIITSSHSSSGLNFIDCSVPSLAPPPPPPPPPPPTTISTAEYPLGPHNRISELNYSHLLNRRQRGEKRPIPDEQKDEKYYERRKRNNEAAKKSRDARKLREDRIAFRAAILEQENAILRAQLIALREEISTMRQIIGTRPAQISVNL